MDLTNLTLPPIPSSNALDMPICQRLEISFNFGRNLVQGEGPSGVQQGGEGEPSQKQAEQGARASTSQPILAQASSFQPPPRPVDNQPPWKKILDKLMCIEAKVKKGKKENKRNAEHLQRMAAHLEALPTPPSSLGQQDVIWKVPSCVCVRESTYFMCGHVCLRKEIYIYIYIYILCV